MISRIDDIAEELQRSIQGRVSVNEPLDRHTSWRVGGPADLFVEPKGRVDVETAITLLLEQGFPYRVLGLGSNVLVSDTGIRGAVIKMTGLKGIDIEPNGTVVVEAGVTLSKLVRRVVELGYAGIEELVAIPGTVGGAAVMNAGARGQEIGSVVIKGDVLRDGKVVALTKADFSFAYRSSALDENDLVLSLELKLEQGEPGEIENRVEAALTHRKSAQDVGGANAGSVFKNLPDTSAWQLIDQAGLRGYRVGGAAISDVHTNFIVNDQKATAADIMQLISHAQSEVERCTGVQLEPEIECIGFESV